MTQKVRVCAEGEIAPGEYKVLHLKEPVAVFNLDGSYYAVSDFCTHEKCSLTQEGYVLGDEIECGWHYAKFSIRTGEVLAPPATQDLKTYQTVIEGGNLCIVMEDE